MKSTFTVNMVMFCWVQEGCEGSMDSSMCALRTQALMPCIPWDASACLQVLRTPRIPLKLRCRIEVSGANAQWVVFITYFEWSLSFFPGGFTPT